jgi:ribonuclease HII
MAPNSDWLGVRGMAYLIGMDEAGYGPNLGPLVVSASVWRVAEECLHADLYEVLAEVVTAKPRATDRRVGIADSKLLYQPRGGLSRLERGLLIALASLDHETGSWQAVWNSLGADEAGHRHELPWYAGYDCPVPIDYMPIDHVPIDHDGELLADDALTFREGLGRCGVELIGLASRAVFPPQFNGLVAEYDSKAEALSRTTLDLACDLLEPLDDGPIRVVCDKHGARNRYAPLLQQQWPEVLVEVHGESRAESVYRFGGSERRVEFCFRTKGDRLVPAALASMASKYLRELAMKAFNAFWCAQVDGLRPTAGYPTDAKRFRADIEPALADLGIAEHALWRCR